MSSVVFSARVFKEAYGDGADDSFAVGWPQLVDGWKPYDIEAIGLQCNSSWLCKEEDFIPYPEEESKVYAVATNDGNFSFVRYASMVEDVLDFARYTADKLSDEFYDIDEEMLFPFSFTILRVQGEDKKFNARLVHGEIVVEEINDK